MEILLLALMGLGYIVYRASEHSLPRAWTNEEAQAREGVLPREWMSALDGSASPPGPPPGSLVPPPLPPRRGPAPPRGALPVRPPAPVPAGAGVQLTLAPGKMATSALAAGGRLVVNVPAGAHLVPSGITSMPPAGSIRQLSATSAAIFPAGSGPYGQSVTVRWIDGAGRPQTTLVSFAVLPAYRGRNS